jgi:hypothetical protein
MSDIINILNNHSAGQTSEQSENPVCNKNDSDYTISSDPATTTETHNFCKDDSLSEGQNGVANQPVSTNLAVSGTSRLLHEPGVRKVSDITNILNNHSAGQTSEHCGKPVCDKDDSDSTPTSDPATTTETHNFCKDDNLREGQNGVANQPVSTYLAVSGTSRLLHEPGVIRVSDITNILNNHPAGQTSEHCGNPVSDIVARNSTPTTTPILTKPHIRMKSTNQILSGGIEWAGGDLRAYIRPPDRGLRKVTRGA